MRFRITVVVSRKAALRLGWVASVLAACGFGWGVARFGTDRAPELTIERSPIAVVASPATVPEPGPRPEDGSEPVEQAPPPQPTPKASPKKVGKPRVKPAPVVEPPELVAAVPDPAPPPAPGPSVRERARQVDRLAEGGRSEDARVTAEALLAELSGPSALSAALSADGASETEAKLDTVRVLQVAGREELSQALARELKRSYAGTPAVLESIDRWGVLTPRITAVESSIADGDEVVVTGTLQNPDIGEVRQVRIVVEALDAAGSVLAKIEARVRPKVLLPESRGDFTARFKQLDPTTVMRTRTVLVAWQSEVLDAS